MNRTTLEKNGIFIEEEPTRTKAPPHVSTLRSALLDFDCTIPDRLAMTNDRDLRHLTELAADLGVSDFELEEIKKTIARWAPAKENAESLSLGRDREPEWQSSYLANFFHPWARDVKVAEEDSRR